MGIAKDQGFTLLELLIALGLSTFILSGVYLFFSSQSRAYLTQQSLIQAQEAGQVAVNMLRDRLRQAGGLGCSSWRPSLPVYMQAQSLAEWLPQNASKVIYGYQANEFSWQPSLPSYLANHVRAGTDVLVVHHAYVESANLLQNMANAQATVVLPAHLNLQVGDALVIADCEQADIIQISGLTRQNDQWLVAHQPPYNKSSALSKNYNQDAEVSVLQNAAYYIGDTGRQNAKGDAVYALYQFTGQHQELIEGVSDLQIEYGVDYNADGAVDTIMSSAEINSGVLRSVILMLQTDADSLSKKWYATIELRNS
jgi:type IV pilus assembly protein PilW